LVSTAGLPTAPRLDKPRLSAISFPLLFPAPALLAIFFVYLFAYSVYFGFTNLQLIGLYSIHSKFTGMKNVLFLLNDGQFWSSN
jgi:ABC-type sugar transport system permease subunit